MQDVQPGAHEDYIPASGSSASKSESGFDTSGLSLDLLRKGEMLSGGAEPSGMQA